MPDIYIKEFKFNTRVTPSEIPFFRASICQLSEGCENGLMHNHAGEGLRYGYPLVQYRSVGNTGVIYAVNQGIDEVNRIDLTKKQTIAIGNRKRTLELVDTHTGTFSIDFINPPAFYTIENWLPFSSDNEKLYGNLQNIVERVMFLERILTANMLSFAKGVGIHLDQEIKVSVCDIKSTKKLAYKSIMFDAFDLSFSANLNLPDSIGLGKHMSHGFGVVRRQTT